MLAEVRVGSEFGGAGGDIGRFSEATWPRWALRGYQARVAREIVRSVEEGEGRQFAVAFARQAGKDEMLAQLEAYLMHTHRQSGGSGVVGNPTYKPQGASGQRGLPRRMAGAGE